MAKKEKIDSRFEVTEFIGNGLSVSWCEIIVDKETGVNYLYRGNGTAGGLTVLLDAQGKPVVTNV
jgi:hypothetical protein